MINVQLFLFQPEKTSQNIFIFLVICHGIVIEFLKNIIFLGNKMIQQQFQLKVAEKKPSMDAIVLWLTSRFRDENREFFTIFTRTEKSSKRIGMFFSINY